MDISAYYGSHVALLSAAMTISKGAVLELGSGFGSTPMLHGLCGAMGRELTTIESDQQWMLKFMNYGRSWHRLKHVDCFLDLPEYKDEWGLALIDSGNTGVLEMSLERGPAAIALQDTPILVLHDTCHPWLYQYESAFELFKYRWDWRIDASLPLTSVVSKTIDVANIFSRMGL